METIFIVNPMAGQGKIEKITQKINSLGAKMYMTKSIGDAERHVREICRDKLPIRFISCGGDGTFNEVLNGTIENENAEIGIIPIGTGNDFCRNFDCDFNDIEALLSADTIKCDAIRYTTGNVTRYCANMFNIGFDCNVADLTTQMKKKPLISGPLAYFISIFLVLIKKKGADLKVEIDGKTVYNGPLLLTSLANGRFCGGGIMSNPEALVSDGEMDINIIKNVNGMIFI